MIALWIACGAVWVAALVVLVRDALAAKRIATRVRTLNPSSLQQQLHAARSDAERTITSLREILPLGRRIALAMLSLAHAFASFRSVALRLRSLFG